MSMLSAAGSHARILVTQDDEPGFPARGPVFGTNTLGSLASYDPDSLSWRTSQRCLDGGWMPYSENFPRSGMTRSGTLFQLAPLVRRIKESESGLWGTPTAHPRTHTPRKVANGRQLANQVFGTDARYPTPVARDWKSGKGKTQAERGRTAGPSLSEAIGGSLNPTWVEWLMGFPLGWTDLGDSATRSCRRSRNGSGDGSRKLPM